ncbi:cobalamin B12-binding domain-containing protein [Methylibium sp.]|uniref:cobalamin B12-binding domain-containing protein n=1 Tax=Methylibium sp. TaxID=2067992 RepID=UPI002DB76A23|nr:cobalamin B12-binding domain-containing protein [Methylibium sp.]
MSETSWKWRGPRQEQYFERRGPMANRPHDGRQSDTSAAERYARESWDGGSKIGGTGGLAAGPERAARLDTPATWLLQAIQTEIIPRLMLAHRESPLPSLAAGVARHVPGPDDVALLAKLVLGRDPNEASAHVERLHAEGMSLEMIYLDLLAPTACRLGELWESDDCDFSEVTIGLWRLQQVMHQLSPEFLDRPQHATAEHRVLLAPAPGSQHTFGLHMVAEFFRRAGWKVLDHAECNDEQLRRTVGGEWFDVIGLSVGSEVHIEGLAAVILDLRRLSANPALVVMVGGPLLVKHPELLARLGADATARDAPHAVAQAQDLLASRGQAQARG